MRVRARVKVRVLNWYVFNKGRLLQVAPDLTCSAAMWKHMKVLRRFPTSP